MHSGDNSQLRICCSLLIAIRPVLVPSFANAQRAPAWGSAAQAVPAVWEFWTTAATSEALVVSGRVSMPMSSDGFMDGSDIETLPSAFELSEKGRRRRRQAGKAAGAGRVRWRSI